MASQKRSYRHDCALVRAAGLDIEDGLVFTFSCADYAPWVANLNGYSVEEAADRLRTKPEPTKD